MQNWTADELQTADLGDERLDRRFSLLLDALGRKPALKFNAACNGCAEVQGAYRFVNNPHVHFANLLAPHHDATRRRCRDYAVVLAVGDTTEIDVTRPHEKMLGAGPLSDEHRWGFFLHPLLVFTPQGLPLGISHTKVWARDPDEVARPAAQKDAQRKRKPIEQKESLRWLEGYRAACDLACACPDTQVISVGDSESDVFECFFEAVPQEGVRKADWIIRACEDRALVQGEAEQPPLGRLFAQVAGAPVLTTLTLEVRQRPAQSGDGRKRKQARSARKTTVTVQAARVTLRQPARPGGKRMADVAVNAVLVREVNPPAGEAAIEWLLLSSLPIDDLEQVLRVVEYYCARWQIEIYFKVLKSGCQVEASQLETAEAFLPYLALCLIVAWRVQQLLMLGRECPELPCDCVLTEQEWQAVYAVVKGQEPPATPPPLGEMVRLIALLGGYLGRKGDGPPGPKAMWIGMQRMTDLALGWQARSHQAAATEQANPRPKATKVRPDSSAQQHDSSTPRSVQSSA
jgi:hypothetical protein